MLEVTSAQLQAWVVMFLWPFARILSFVMAAPLFGHSNVPARVKVILAFLLTVLVASILPPLPEVSLLSWAGVGILAEQVLIGLAMGFIMHIVFAVVMVAGEYIGLQMGLGFASFFSPDTGTNSMVLSRIFYMVALLAFLALNGHLFFIEILADSFTTLPIGLMAIDFGAFNLMARFTSVVFASGLLLALPLVTALLMINLSMGILNRAAPQFTIFSIGFPMSLITGLILLGVLMSDFGIFLELLFAQGLGFLQSFIDALAGNP